MITGALKELAPLRENPDNNIKSVAADSDLCALNGFSNLFEIFLTDRYI